MKDLKFIYTHFVQQCQVYVECAVSLSFHSTNEETEALGCSYVLEIIVAEGRLDFNSRLGLFPFYLNGHGCHRVSWDGSVLGRTTHCPCLITGRRAKPRAQGKGSG